MRFSYGASKKIHGSSLLGIFNQIQQNSNDDLLQQGRHSNNNGSSTNSKSQDTDHRNVNHTKGLGHLATPNHNLLNHQNLQLIRISPKLIRKQVQSTTKYRPRRSLLLLGILVVLSLLVLFALSQMAVVQHTMVAQLGTAKPKIANQVVINGPKSWRAQFSQFKIEPLLIRNAPSVEVNTALAENSRLAARTAALIYRHSLPKSPGTMNISMEKMTSSVSSRLLPQLPQSVSKSLSPSVQGDSSILDVFHSLQDIHSKGFTIQPSDRTVNAQHNYDRKGLLKKRRNISISELKSNKDLCNRLNKENIEPLLRGENYNENSNIDCTNIRINETINFSDTKNKIGIDKNETNASLDIEKHSFPFTPKTNNESIYINVDPQTALPRSTTKYSNRTKLKRRSELEEDGKPEKKLCPEVPDHLLGHLQMSLDELEQVRMEDALVDLDWVKPGGRWSPEYDTQRSCRPRHHVAVIVPFRDRYHHLVIFLRWLHPILRRQQLAYTIYVAEQVGNATFNKGALMNAGFLEAWRRGDADCFVFHDVDLLPEDDRNMYSCPPQPRHLSVGVDTLGYRLPYFLLVGGVLSVQGHHFFLLNGYSNMYWGWGGEDDDMGYRIKQSGLSITRPPNSLARYSMIRHTKRKPLNWKIRGKLLRTSGRRYRLDGLNTLRYHLISTKQKPLFTHLMLDVGSPPENLLKLDKQST